VFDETDEVDEVDVIVPIKVCTRRPLVINHSAAESFHLVIVL